MVSVGSGQSFGTGIISWSHTWRTGAQALVLSSAAFLGVLPASWFGSQAARLQPAPCYGMPVHCIRLMHCTTLVPTFPALTPAYPTGLTSNHIYRLMVAAPRNNILKPSISHGMPPCPLSPTVISRSAITCNLITSKICFDPSQ